MLIGGRYEIIRELGRGGFGKTYLADDTYRRNSPKCVVKKLQLRSNNPALLQVARERFDQEAQILYQLKSYDQTPRLMAHFEQNGEFYLVQELVDGSNLGQTLSLGARLEESDVVELLRDILEVLAVVHQFNIIHQDVKPQNLIRRWKDKKLVLIDFGGVKSIRNLVINAHGQTTLTQSVGTPGYTPPEQLNGNPKFASDIYAAGVIGIQSVTGFLPNQLPRKPDTQELDWHDQASVSPQLTRILDKMVRIDLDHRYSSVLEVLQDLPPSPNVSRVPPTVLVSQMQEPKKPNYRVAIEPQYDEACNFSEGLAGVVLGDKLGYLDRSGTLVVQPKLPFSPISMFRGAYQFVGGLARVDVDHRWGYVDKTGNFVIPPQYEYADDFSEGLARVELEGRYGYIDDSGIFAIKPQYESAGSFSEGLTGVEIDHRYGYIDKTGQVIIDPQFDSADVFVEGLARITLNDKYGFIDKIGQLVIPVHFDVAHTFQDGLARVRVDGYYGYISTTGELVIPPQFEDTFSFSEGLALVRNGDRYGYIDRTGKIKIELQFEDAYSFSSGLAAVKQDNQWKYIDKQGETVSPLRFEEAASISEGLARVKQNNKWGYFTA